MSLGDSWARTHAAKFAPEKFELIHFTNPEATTGINTEEEMRTAIEDVYEIDTRIGNDKLPVRTTGKTIQPTTIAKYLGVWLDQTLSFDSHRSKLAGKANTSLDALRGMTGSTWGASLMAMRQVYRAVVVPQMLYGATAWFSPKTKAQENSIVSIFTGIQRRAAIIIAGAFKSMSAAALNVELFLLPIRLQLRLTTQETVLRLQTGAVWARPKSLKTRPPRTTKEIQTSGLTPIERIQNTCPALQSAETDKWESRTAFVCAPWEPRIEGVIQSAEVAQKTHDDSQADALRDEVNDWIDQALVQSDIEPTTNRKRKQTLFFTDGSGARSQICAAAVAPAENIYQTRYLGDASVSIVHMAELSAIELALAEFRALCALDPNSVPRDLTIFADCQAAIQAVTNPRRSTGQHILHAIYAHFRALRSLRAPPEVILRWVPAHAGVQGNELADCAAKETARKAVEERAQPGTTVRLATCARSQIRKEIKREWAESWHKDKTGRSTHQLVPLPHAKVLKLYNGLSRPYTSILVQMRSMRVGLRHFLYKINEAESDQCSCRTGSQTPRHVVLQCPLFIGLRRSMMEKIARTDLGRSTDYNELVNHPQATR